MVVGLAPTAFISTADKTPPLPGDGVPPEPTPLPPTGPVGPA
jgi:hypothetical protein